MNGRLILVNGSPSAGKTSLVRAIMTRLEEPWFHHNLDRHLLGYDESQPHATIWPRALLGYEACLHALVGAGQDVIAESVLPFGDPQEFIALVAPFSPFTIALTCDIDVVHQRERERMRRTGHYFVSAEDHAAVESFSSSCDATLNSTTRTVSDLADEAAKILTAGGFRGQALIGGATGPARR